MVKPVLHLVKDLLGYQWAGLSPVGVDIRKGNWNEESKHFIN